MNVVKCENVSKVFYQASETIYALREVSLSIDSSEFVCLSGPSGSGKSTLLNMIGSLDKPTEGNIWLAGHKLNNLNKSEISNLRLNEIGFVFQAYNLIPVLSAKENVEFVMHLQGINTLERTKRAMNILSQVGLAGLENRRPAELSGGQQQRVAVARAIVSRPKLVLADEPTANLDSVTAQSLVALMRHMNEQEGITFIFSTHDPVVMSSAKRIIKLKDGEIVSA